MAFTNINAVALLYPSFKRGVPNQSPSDTLIQQFINDVGDIIVAILERRFNESISEVGSTNQWLVSLGLPDITWLPNFPVNEGDIIVDSNDPMATQQAQNAGTTGANIPTWSSIYGGATTDGTVVWNNIGQSRQFRVLERGNRYGAASQLGAVMASFAVRSALDLAKEYTKADWVPFKNELNAEDDKGSPKTYGMFDFLFDPQANVQTPRPQMIGISGGDQPVGVGPDLEGVGSAFGKWGRDYGRHSEGRRWPT